MGVQVTMPQQKQETSMGRRLFAMAAPVAGFALGGPAGAAAGSLIGSKLAGASTSDSIMNAAQTGAQAAVAPKATPTKTEGLDLSTKLQKPELGESAFSRRFSNLSADPKMQIQEGLNALTMLPPDLRKQYTGTLVKAQFAGGR